MSGPRIAGLFEGYGGLTMAARSVLGGDLAWYAEIEPGACRLLAHHHPGVPNVGDVSTVDWSAVERPDVFTGGFPCQDLSLAGLRAGLRPGTRSGLWEHFAYAIDQLRPGLVLIENVRGLLSAEAACDLEPCPWCVGDGEGRPLRALGAVLGDLADIGYDAQWVGLRAADVGSPHGRFRVFVIAWPAADAESIGRGEGRTEPAGIVGRPDVAGSGGAAVQDADCAARSERGIAAPGQAQGGRAWPDAGGRGGVSVADAEDDGRAPLQSCGSLPERPGTAGDREDAVQWGAYEPAIRRWELSLGRAAPAPTRVGQRGGQQLSPLFVEWMMGLPEGHVTGVPGLSRNEQLRMLGNGVVPQQAAAALQYLLAATTADQQAYALPGQGSAQSPDQAA
jgi:DNA (cytosine-5)-methyltransferase 1